jgi:S1-C subfamily serine protease
MALKTTGLVIPLESKLSIHCELVPTSIPPWIPTKRIRSRIVLLKSRIAGSYLPAFHSWNPRSKQSSAKFSASLGVGTVTTGGVCCQSGFGVGVATTIGFGVTTIARSIIQITAPISHGSSGSPVLDSESGQVLGIVQTIYEKAAKAFVILLKVK